MEKLKKKLASTNLAWKKLVSQKLALEKLAWQMPKFAFVNLAFKDLALKKTALKMPKLALKNLALKKLVRKIRSLASKSWKLEMALREKENRPLKKHALGLKRDVRSDDEILASLRRLCDAERQSSGIEISDNSIVRRSSPLDKLCKQMRFTTFGLVSGRLTYYGRHGEFTCSRWKHCISVTSDIYALQSDALFILLINSPDIFYSLVDDGFSDRFPCIMLQTGELQPDGRTRLFLKMLKMELKLPVFALMDCDPHAIELLFTCMDRRTIPSPTTARSFSPCRTSSGSACVPPISSSLSFRGRSAFYA